jgi:DNA-binding transcriptional MerR regulator
MAEVENQQSTETQTYSLIEVSQFLDVNESTLRNWEKRFGDFLGNYRNQYNHRLFTQDDIKTLERVKYLLESGIFTVPGVQHMLKTGGGDAKGIAIAPVAAVAQPVAVQPNPFDEEYKQKLIFALNSLGSEVHSLRREVREDLKGSLKGELDHLKLLLFPPVEPKKPWWKLF